MNKSVERERISRINKLRHIKTQLIILFEMHGIRDDNYYIPIYNCQGLKGNSHLFVDANSVYTRQTLTDISGHSFCLEHNRYGEISDVTNYSKFTEILKRNNSY